MNIQLAPNFSFTDEPAASSYGQPGLVFAGEAFGAADELPDNEKFSYGTTAAEALRYFYETGDIPKMRHFKNACMAFLRLGGVRVD